MTAYSKIEDKTGKYATIDQILSLNKFDGSNRTILLARIDAAILGHLFESKGPEVCLVSYVIDGESRPSQIPDVMHMFNRLSTDAKQSFISLLEKSHDQISDKLLYAQLIRATKIKTGTWSEKDIVHAKTYIEACYISSEDAEKASLKEYCLALIHFDLFIQRERSLSCLISAISFLRSAVSTSPGNFLFRLLLSVALLNAGTIRFFPILIHLLRMYLLCAGGVPPS